MESERGGHGFKQCEVASGEERGGGLGRRRWLRGKRGEHLAPGLGFRV